MRTLSYIVLFLGMVYLLIHMTWSRTRNAPHATAHRLTILGSLIVLGSTTWPMLDPFNIGGAFGLVLVLSSAWSQLYQRRAVPLADRTTGEINQ